MLTQIWEELLSPYFWETLGYIALGIGALAGIFGVSYLLIEATPWGVVLGAAWEATKWMWA